MAQNNGFRRTGGSKFTILVLWYRKGTSVCKAASFDIFCIKICASVLAVGDWKNPHKTNNSWVNFGCGKSCMRRNESGWNFCRMIDIPDNLCNFWWWSVEIFGSAWGQMLPFCRCRPYNALPLPCDCVICGGCIAGWTQDDAFTDLLLLRSSDIVQQRLYCSAECYRLCFRL